MNKHINKLRSTGLFAGLLGVVCLPCILAPLLISVGLSSALVFLGSWLTPFLLVLVGISLVGFILSFRMHKNVFPLLLALLAGGTFFYGRFVVNDRTQTLAYAGAAFLIIAVITDYIICKRHKAYCEDCVVKPEKKEQAN